jgi:hypothetical protein
MTLHRQTAELLAAMAALGLSRVEATASSGSPTSLALSFANGEDWS